MKRFCICFTAIAFVLGLNVAVTGFEKEKTRNPFNVTDVPDPDGEDVKTFAASVKLAADGKDANAEQWVQDSTKGAKKNSIDGEWSSRWNGGSAKDWETGSASVKSSGDRVYILYKDRTGTYLIDAKRDGKTRLVGRYLAQRDDKESAPWVAEIVNDERIDGEWPMGRWDLRRKLTGK